MRDPALTAALIGAVERARAGDWEAAHLVAQDHEEDALASWLHAIVHRMEGDDGNAAYWYRRSGRVRSGTVAEELARLREELGA